jgi:succinate dehydrogenase/fumarate reductase flavoprotein subunit
MIIYICIYICIYILFICSGLYGVGECAGGVHGKNRLGSSGLLGCVVYGRVAGATATNYLLNEFSTSNSNSTSVNKNNMQHSERLYIEL